MKNKGKNQVAEEQKNWQTEKIQFIDSFKTFQKINTFGRDIYNGKTTLKVADKDQNSLLVEIMNFKSNIKPRNPEKKHKKKGYS